MKKVNISDKPTRTWLGGIWGVPIADLSNERTITIRVKDVARTKMEGASDRTVKRSKSSTPVLTCFGSPPGSTDNVIPGADKLGSPAQPESSKAAIILIKTIRKRLFFMRNRCRGYQCFEKFCARMLAKLCTRFGLSDGVLSFSTQGSGMRAASSSSVRQVIDWSVEPSSNNLSPAFTRCND